ncbi:NgoPII family restriction endonuclease [Avibacterium paragallinarum]|uniref:NgoPII family restriction endonuclease n=2 Tax=Avibacterium paragallinarum TaxID=728 RepID=UPI00300F7AD3
MNIINAIINLIKRSDVELNYISHNNNRINAIGDSLESYVKDLFANSFELSLSEKIQKQSEVFSYLGNKSNPPDAMLRDGDAIEVKKIEAPTPALVLNSSYPKAKLFSDSPMISRACREAENWQEKDLIYIVGVVDRGQKIRHLAMVYGQDYCADENCYLKIKQKIKAHIENMADFEFSDTQEFARINRVDPLGITYLRVRGMWGIENPWTVFRYIYQRDAKYTFNFMAVINEDKWNSFNNYNELLELKHPNLRITDVEIQNPNNPAQLKPAKLITFFYE